MCSEHKDEEAIFKAAVKIEAQAERDIYLERVCGNNPELLARIGILLKGHYEADDFLEIPVFEPAITLEDSPLSEAPGTLIGPYKLLELIGSRPSGGSKSTGMRMLPRT